MILKKKSKAARAAVVAAVILLVIMAGCAVYLGDYYAAAPEAFDAGMRVCDDGDLLWEPEGANAGLIFYPGGKVEHAAYAPLMGALADKGILCVLVEMPFRLAVFDVGAAEGIPEAYPQIERWYIGGHSLGGSMAANYLAGSPGAYEGLILLGSYAADDLSGTDLDVLSILGSEDRVLNREKYEQNKANLPDDFCEVVIDGGCHAYFGMYGPQDGDGTPTITNEEQITLTADAIAALVGSQEEP